MCGCVWEKEREREGGGWRARYQGAKDESERVKSSSRLLKVVERERCGTSKQTGRRPS